MNNKINNTQVLKEEWDLLRNFVNSNKTDKSILRDGVLETSEIPSLFDTNRDHKTSWLEMAGVAKAQGSHFLDLSNLLQRHGINLYEGIEAFVEKPLSDYYLFTDNGENEILVNDFNAEFGSLCTDPLFISYFLNIRPSITMNGEEGLINAIFSHAPETVFSDIDIMRQALGISGGLFNRLPDEMQDNTDLQNIAVVHGGYRAITTSDPSKKADIELALQASYYNTDDYRYYVSADLKTKDFNLKVLRINPDIIKCIEDIIDGDYKEALSQGLDPEHQTANNEQEVIIRAIRIFEHTHDVLNSERQTSLIYFYTNVLSEEIRKKPAVAAAYLCIFPYRKSDIDSSLLNNADFVLNVLRNSDWLNESLVAPFIGDVSFMRQAVELYPELYKSASESVKEDEEVARNAVLKKPDLVNLLPDTLYNNPNFLNSVVNGLKMNVGALTLFLNRSKYFKSNPDKWQEFASISGILKNPIFISAIADLPKEKLQDFMNEYPNYRGKVLKALPFRKDLDEAASILIENWASMSTEERQLFGVNTQNYMMATDAPEINGLMMAMIMDNRFLFWNLDTDKQNEIWPSLVQTLRDAGFKFPESILNSFDNFKEALASKTKNEDRFISWRDLESLFLTRKDLIDTKPTIIIFMASYDNNGAFVNYSQNSPMDDFRTRGYQVVVREITSFEDWIFEAKEVSGNGENSFDVLMLRAHGEESSAALDGDDIMVSEKVELADFANPEAAILGQIVSGAVMFESCSTGTGGDDNDNMINAYRNILPKQVTLFAPRFPSGIDGYNISRDRKGQIKSIVPIYREEEHFYQTHGKL
ncbi:DUF4116 domain-containing protein [bacterium]|nr:DUF4116 domain-containing protein [bacterium]